MDEFDLWVDSWFWWVVGPACLIIVILWGVAIRQRVNYISDRRRGIIGPPLPVRHRRLRRR